jgi:SpoVK/Ycf46/Vps4 family AAA+-type ATPase
MSKRDPTRINEYNKFLATLDKTCITTNVPIDKISENLELYSSGFTGQTIKDIKNVNSNIKNENEYIDVKEKKQYDSTCCKSESYKYCQNNQLNIHYTEDMIEIKETIHIDTEINNISDILKLIETYKAEPSIKYNINMKSLHNIKEPLEELNNMIGMKDLKNNIVDQILYFSQELHKDNISAGDFMHSVIYGPPGTGKTE